MTNFPHLFGEKFIARHGDPDFVFIQPWLEDCWSGYKKSDGCGEASTRIFVVWFATTVFVQGICEEHAQKLQGRMEELDFNVKEGAGWVYGRNQKEIEAIQAAILSRGGIELSDATWDVAFPKNWMKCAILVVIRGVGDSCWYQDCERPTRVSMLVWKAPSGMARKGRLLRSVDDMDNRFVVRVCEGHQGGVQRDLQKAGFSRYAKRTGGLGFQNPKSVLPPFGSVDWRPDDPNDGLPLPEPKENVA